MKKIKNNKSLESYTQELLFACYKLFDYQDISFEDYILLVKKQIFIERSKK